MEGLHRNAMMTERPPPHAAPGSGILVLRTVARAMVLPILVLLLAGLVAAIRDRLAADVQAAAAVTTLPLPALLSADRLATPLGLLTAGLVVLAVTPTVTVLSVAVAHGRGRRWREAAIAAGVLAILALSVAFKPHG